MRVRLAGGEPRASLGGLGGPQYWQAPPMLARAIAGSVYRAKASREIVVVADRAGGVSIAGCMRSRSLCQYAPGDARDGLVASK